MLEAHVLRDASARWTPGGRNYRENLHYGVPRSLSHFERLNPKTMSFGTVSPLTDNGSVFLLRWLDAVWCRPVSTSSPTVFMLLIEFCPERLAN